MPRSATPTQFPRSTVALSGAMLALSALSVSVSAQSATAAKSTSKDTTSKKPDAMAGMAGMDHMHMMPGKKETMPSTGWKELDAYHALMMATWHPAKQDGDMAPIRAKASALASAAKTLAASTPPKRCALPKLTEAAKQLAPQTQAVANMVAKNASNNELKDALKALHEHFDVLEEGCAPPAKPAAK